MFNLVSLVVAAALVSLQSDFQASGALLSNKIDLDNSLQPNVVTPKRLFRKYIHIYLPPPETIKVVPGQTAQLECQVYGSPSPSVSWLKNGEPIVDYEEEANEILSSHPSSLARMTSKLVLSSPSNGDVYTCLATAGLKQKTSSTTVYVLDGEDPDALLEKLLIPPKPVITSYYNEVFQNMGSNIVLPCRTHGDAQLYWQDNNDNVVFDDARLRVLPSGDLLISSLRWSDMGQFTCIVQNSYGKDSASTFLYPTKAS